MLEQPVPTLFVPVGRETAPPALSPDQIAAPAAAVAPPPAGAFAWLHKDWRRQDWRRTAPRLSAAVLAALGVAELGGLTWDLLAIPPVPGPTGTLKAVPARVHWWRLSGAHLFGMSPVAAEAEAGPVLAHPVSWSLTGVIAAGDPAKGFAIVGEQGRVLEVLKAGSPIQAIPGSKLSQVFSDHVVIDLQGRLQSVNLPKDSHPSGGAPVRMAAMPMPAAMPPPMPMPGPDVMFTAPTPGDADVGEGTVPVPAPYPGDGQAPPTPAPTPAEALLSDLNPEGRQDGQKGMTLHPNVKLQRQFGLKEGDVLTSVNGVPLTDPGALNTAMKVAGETISVTYTRDGVEQTVTMPTNN